MALGSGSQRGFDPWTALREVWKEGTIPSGSQWVETTVCPGGQHSLQEASLQRAGLGGLGPGRAPTPQGVGARVRHPLSCPAVMWT